MSLADRLQRLHLVGLTPRVRAADALERLLSTWESYGAVLNLTADSTRGGLMPHVEEAFSVLESAATAAGALGRSLESGWVDLGSGGGFPGLVVAAIWPGPVFLVEPRAKRAAFLRVAAGQIGHVGTVWEERIDVRTWDEKWIERIEEREKVEIGILSARAVWPREIVEDLAGRCGRRGFVAHLKPTDPESLKLRTLARVDHGQFSARVWCAESEIVGRT